jgi:MoxR-like ATPase
MRMSTPGHTGQRTATKQLFDRMMAEIAKIYVGQDELVVGTLVALFSNGHVLIESVPGLGKTLFVRTLGRVLGLKFGRIQFTADLMPSDITGAPIFDMKTQEFRFRPGPVFTQLLLADEINRAPAKTHASLLEIMQEFRVTVDGQSHRLEKPFLVLATQNPIESEGTYNLPEAQLDRFMFKLIASYPAFDEEKNILQLHSGQADINRRLEEDLAVITSSGRDTAARSRRTAESSSTTSWSTTWRNSCGRREHGPSSIWAPRPVLVWRSCKRRARSPPSMVAITPSLTTSCRSRSPLCVTELF